MRVWPALLGVTALAVAGAGTGVAVTWTPERTQYLHDAYVAWAEPIPDDVAAIARATGMSEFGELVYRASTPAVEDDDAFVQHCPLEGGAVLGCYANGDIYVYAVTDSRLAGTVEVTAAHEMLHAAYERLTREERERVDALVDAAVARLPEDHPVFADIAHYAAPQLASEWHSRLGTEFAGLDPELEAHYARYFDDRSLVVALNEQATALFREIQARIEELVAEIEELDPILDARIARYERTLDAFNADVAAFNRRAETGGFSSLAQFEAERAVLVDRSERLEAERTAIDRQIAHYNDLVAELTELDADYAELYSALDARDGAETVDP